MSSINNCYKNRSFKKANCYKYSTAEKTKKKYKKNNEDTSCTRYSPFKLYLSLSSIILLLMLLIAFIRYTVNF